MPFSSRYVRPKVSPSTLLRAAVPFAEDAMAELLLKATLPDVPVETEALKNTGRTVRTELGTAVTFGDDKPVEAHGGKSTNDYVVIVHSDPEKHHPVGKDHFLMDAMYHERAAMLAVAAETLRKVF